MELPNSLSFRGCGFIHPVIFLFVCLFAVPSLTAPFYFQEANEVLPQLNFSVGNSETNSLTNDIGSVSLGWLYVDWRDDRKYC